MPEEVKKLFCPQCKEWYDATHFECLPLDLRCNKCIPADAAMLLYDKRVQKAGQDVARVFEKAEGGRGLKPLARLIDGMYDAWGGPQALCEDAVAWAKDLGSGRGKGAALAFIAKLLAIHAKVERTQVDEDWNQLTKEEIKAKLTLMLASLMAEQESGSAKKNAIRRIMGDSPE